MRLNDATIIARPRFVKQGKRNLRFYKKTRGGKTYFAYFERRKKAGEQKKRERASVPFFAKISYLPPKIRLPSPVEVKNRMSMTTGTTYFIITL